MSRERQTKKEMFEFSTKSSESLTLSDIARQTVPRCLLRTVYKLLLNLTMLLLVYLYIVACDISDIVQACTVSRIVQHGRDTRHYRPFDRVMIHDQID